MEGVDQPQAVESAPVLHVFGQQRLRAGLHGGGAHNAIPQLKAVRARQRASRIDHRNRGRRGQKGSFINVYLPHRILERRRHTPLDETQVLSEHLQRNDAVPGAS
jgi:hypothetical protein